MPITEELKRHPYWCVRKEKVPYNPKTGRKAEPNNPDTFGTYNEAAAVAEKYDGIGISLRDGLSCVDIDHCIENGVISPQAQKIIDYMESYTEYSPSKTGFHILFHTKGVTYDKERFYIKNPQNGVELYLSDQTQRYVTVTGDTLPGHAKINPIPQCDIDAFAEEYMRRDKKGAIGWDDEIKKEYPSDNDMTALDEKAIIEKARNAANGDKFNRLYKGDWNGYDSQSEADQALCNILAYWCGNDSGMIDSIFRQSGLYRSKWDEKRGPETYGQRTINRAIKDSVSTDKAYKNTDIQTEPEEWETPIPLDDEPLPPFPIGCLPPVIGNYVKAVSESCQVSVDMAATAALVTVAICVQKKFLIKGKPDWLEPLNLYALIVAPPAERKSAVMQALTKQIHIYERVSNELHQEDIEASRIRKSILQKKVTKLESEVISPKNPSKGKKPVTEDDVLAAQRELSAFKEEKPIRLLVDDCTPERLTCLLEENNEKMAMVSAEGGIFEVMSGRYSKSTNIDVFLKAHPGDPIRIDRIGRASVYVPHPALCLLLAVQPSILNGLMSNKDFRGRGLTARFLYCIPQSKVGNRSFETKPIPEHTEWMFNEMLNSLLGIEQQGTPQIITLSPEAYRTSADFAVDLEPRLRGDLEPLGDWAGKLHGAILRIAAALHLVENKENGAARPVAFETMCSAIAIGNYYLEHAKRAYKIMGADEQLQGAKYIIGLLQKQRYTIVSRSEMTRLCRSRLSSKDLDAPLDLLEDYGYLRKNTPQYKGLGARPAPEYHINPQLYGE